MPEAVNEWEFTGDTASWINELLPRFPELPFSRAKVEQTRTGSRRRRDISLLDRSRTVVLTGEIKLPDREDGGTPYNAKVVRDARAKAIRARAPFFFTWNVNECVLWETQAASGGEWQQQRYKAWPVTSIRRSDQLNTPSVIADIQRWLPLFLREVADALASGEGLGTKSPDEHFVAMLESALSMPIVLNFDELERLYAGTRFKTQLDEWMREDQGWTIYDDPSGVRDNLERSAKLACYTLLNKLVFHEALLRRYGNTMHRLSVPAHITTGDALRRHLEGYFAEARTATSDYETVFGEEHTSIGNRIPFYADGAVPHWRALIAQIHAFDFSRLDYEVIGSVFERLIAPEERRKYGQYYTRVEVVDLINSFCIFDGTESVMDPACGGGTFLVRAYVRKRELAPGRSHSALLTDLFGIDTSQFATHLTTINLATRDLIEEANYPQIARSDFFDVDRNRPFLTLPADTRGRGARARLPEHREVVIPPLNAVMGNPPYVRQEDIPRSRGRAVERGTQEYYHSLAQREAGLDLSGRSDLHCYFWPHAATFLRDDGYLCFLASSQWLDIEYGFPLQRWILRNFEIVAILESIDEPWFVGARVVTAVTILRRQRTAARRMNNVVRFIQLRRPMADLLSNDGTTAGAVSAADSFRDELLRLTSNIADDRYRARLVPQRDLWRAGVELGAVLGESRDRGDSNSDTETGDYYGGKWGIHLRAPDLWFAIVDEVGDRFVPLADIADVRFGVKTGRDTFFYPKDISSEALEEEPDPAAFQTAYGVSRRRVESGDIRIVRCGEQYEDIRPIESRFLEPEIHSLMDIDTYSATAEDSTRQILLVGQTRSQLRGTFALKYIQWGEQTNVHQVETVAARAGEDREWYDLTNSPRCDIVLPKIQQYRLIAFLNPDRLYQNSSLLGLYDVAPDDVQPLCAALNSSIAILSRLLYARILGNEGNIQLDVYLAKMMLVPDVRRFDNERPLRRLKAAFRRMLRRPVRPFLSERRLREMVLTEAGDHDELAELSDESELDMPDRRDLDDALLELLGISDPSRREVLREELYAHLRTHFELTRRKEELAIINRRVSRQRGVTRPAEIAAQIFAEIQERHGDLLRPYDPFFLNRDQPFDTVEVPLDGDPELHSTFFAPDGVAFKRGRRLFGTVEVAGPEQAELIVQLAQEGVRGLVRIPRDPRETQAVVQRFRAFAEDRSRRLTALVVERSADPDLQEAIAAALRTFISSGR